MSTNMKPVLLHAHRTGPNPLKIVIALEVLKVPYTLQLWELGDDPHNGVKSAKLLRLNENGRVPVLEDPNTGVTSWESGAVMNYLLRVYDKDNKLGPRGDSEQDRVDFDKWQLFLLTTLGPMTGQLNWFRHYNDEPNKNALDRYIAQTYRCYDVLEGQLKKSGGKTVLPGGFSAVDCHFEPWVRQCHYAQLSLEQYPLIKAYLDNMAEMPDVKKAYAAIKEATTREYGTKYAFPEFFL